MFALKKNQTYRNAIRTERKLAEPEPTYGKPRPAVGFFASLTPEQKAFALAYRGDENHGDDDYRR